MKVLLAWSPTKWEWSIIEAVWPPDLDLVVGADSGGLECTDVDVVVGSGHSLPLDRFREWPSLRLVHLLGHGLDGLTGLEARKAMAGRDIHVARASSSAVAIAEFAIMNMVALSRQLIQVHRRLSEFGDWSHEYKARRGDTTTGVELNGSVLGLLGYGPIAQQIHQRAISFGMSVGALVRRPDRLSGVSNLEFTASPERLAAFLSRCDYVVVCLPLTADTEGLLDASMIGSMKEGAFLLNIARGGIVDEAALHAALQSGRLAGAALDVWEVESSGGGRGYPSSFPLHQYNVIMTPHYAGVTKEARIRALDLVGNNIARLAAGQTLQNSCSYDSLRPDRQ